MNFFAEKFSFKTEFVPINNYRKPWIKRETKQPKKDKAEYFHLLKLDVIT